MRSNAGLANRQREVDLRSARLHPQLALRLDFGLAKASRETETEAVWGDDWSWFSALDERQQDFI
jgi:hypothetical protein